MPVVLNSLGSNPVTGRPQVVYSTPSESTVGRSGPNLEPGTMRVYITNGPRTGLNIGRKVSPCTGSRRWWVLGSVHAFSQDVHAGNT